MPILRSLVRQPSYLALSVATLTLAVGANLVVFTIVNAIWLKPRPVRDPDRVVMVMADTRSVGSQENFWFAELGLQRQVREVPAFELVAGQVMTSGFNRWLSPRIIFEDVGRPVETLGVTSEYFGVLGLPIRGRDFTRDDDRDGAAPVAIISDGLWRSAFGARPEVIGAHADATPLPISIIGVAPRGFAGARLGEQADLWVPRSLVPVVSSVPRDHTGLATSNPPMLAIARLRPGVSPPQAERAIEQHGQARGRLAVVPLSQIFGSPEHRTLIINEGPVLRLISAAAVLVLLGGCATLMGLILVHYERRRSEFAIRLAIGASAGRLTRRLLMELACLVAIGSVSAGLAAAWGLHALPALDLPGGVSLARRDLQFDWRVVVVGLAVAIITMLVAAALPMRRFTAAGIACSLVTPSVTASAGSLRLRKIMLATQACSTVVVLVAAGLFLRTVQYGFGRGPGFDAAHTLFVEVDVGTFFDMAAAMRSQPGSGVDRRTFTDRASAALRDRYRASSESVIEMLEREPGVESVTVGLAPLGPDPSSRVSQPRTVETESGSQQLRAARAYVAPGYFDALGVRIVAGRALTAADLRPFGQPAPVVVTASLAGALWPGRSPLGRRIKAGGEADEVVGVVEDFAYGSMRFDPPYAVFAAVTLAEGATRTLSLVIRADHPGSALEPLERKLAALVPSSNRISVKTGHDLVAADLGRERLGAWFFSGFSLVATVLGAAGVFGMVLYLAESRRREFGIRLALGATPSHLMRMVMSAGLVPVAAGTVLGLVGALVLAKVAESFLIGVSWLDAVSYATAALVMVTCATAASVAAAWRLKRIVPNEALRSES